MAAIAEERHVHGARGRREVARAEDVVGAVAGLAGGRERLAARGGLPVQALGVFALLGRVAAAAVDRWQLGIVRELDLLERVVTVHARHALVRRGGESPGVEVGRLVGWALLVVAVVVVAWLVVRLVRASAAERRARSAVMLVGRSPGAGDDDALSKSPDEWRRA